MSRVYDMARRVNKSLCNELEGVLTINLLEDSHLFYMFNDKPITEQQYNSLVSRFNKSNSNINFKINIID